MKTRYTTKNRQITFEIEAEHTKEIFAELAAIQEVFDTEHACGKCGSTDIRFLNRTVTKGKQVFDFYHLQCRACFARFDFGQTTGDGGLFPKRKDKDGNYLPNNGWFKYSAGQHSGGHDQHQSADEDNIPY